MKRDSKIENENVKIKSVSQNKKIEKRKEPITSKNKQAKINKSKLVDPKYFKIPILNKQTVDIIDKIEIIEINEKYSKLEKAMESSFFNVKDYLKILITVTLTPKKNLIPNLKLRNRLFT
jgi:hypothetical protein